MRRLLPQNAFQGFEPVEIHLPDNWDVSVLTIPADDCVPLDSEQILKKIQTPYGLPPLSELAERAREVVIAFDDISRGTPTKVMAEAVLRILHGAGVRDEQIRFICALGTHGAHSRREFSAKLGEDIVSRYRVYNHNCYENNVPIGATADGFEVRINREFWACDLKIGLGAVTPHAFNGFSGGGKLLFPGLADIETVQKNHESAADFLRKNQLNSAEMIGNLSMDGMRREIEEMTALVKGFYKIDAIYNSRLELVDLYAGDPTRAYYAAIPAARKLYAVKRPKGCRVVVANANAKANESQIAVGMAALALDKSGGDIVLINHTQMGQVVHYLLGEFGRGTGGRLYGAVPRHRPQVRRLICCLPYPEPASGHWYGNTEQQIYVKTWTEALELLKEKNGPATKAAVLTDATLCYYSQDV